jgi:hypothetical protein
MLRGALDIVYSGWQLVESFNGMTIYCRLNSAGYHLDYLKELLDNNWLPPHAYLMRREIALNVAEIEGWNPITKVSQDREFFTKAAILGARFQFVPGVFCNYYRRLDYVSVSRNINEEDRAKEIVRMLGRFYEQIGVQGWISSDHKRAYEKILLRQTLFRSVLYNIPFEIKNCPIEYFDWNSVRGVNNKLKKMEQLLAGAS